MVHAHYVFILSMDAEHYSKQKIILRPQKMVYTFLNYQFYKLNKKFENYCANRSKVKWVSWKSYYVNTKIPPEDIFYLHSTATRITHYNGQYKSWLRRIIQLPASLTNTFVGSRLFKKLGLLEWLQKRAPVLVLIYGLNFLHSHILLLKQCLFHDHAQDHRYHESLFIHFIRKLQKCVICLLSQTKCKVTQNERDIFSALSISIFLK